MLLFPLLLLLQLCAMAVATFSFHAEWRELKPSSRIKPRRSGLIAFSSDENKIPFVFGGYVEEDTNDDAKYHRYVKNDLWKWNNKKWQSVNHSGDIPVERLAGAAAVVGNKAYLVGGWNSDAKKTGGDTFLDTVHELDLDTLAWRKLPTLIPDGPCSRHVAVTLPKRDQILVHHHRCDDNHVWLLDPSSSDGGIFTRQKTIGPCPSSRGLHAAALAGPDQFVVFGGAAQDGKMSNEAFVLDTTSWKWSAIKTTDDGPCPSPRAGACMCAIDKDHVIVYGGAERTDEGGLNARSDVWLLSLAEQTWELLISDDGENNGPPPRNGAALLEIKSVDGAKEFLLAGGWAPFIQTWDDCFVLRVTQE